MQEVDIKDFFWKQRSGEILQVRIRYEDGTIKVFNSKGHCLMRWRGLTRKEIQEVETHFLEMVV